MEPIRPIDKLNNLRRQKEETDSTCMNQSQPLNEIGGVTFKEMLDDETEKLNNENKNDNEHYEQGYDKLCDDCQIAKIVGSCMRCGLYQYGNNFDFLIRRKLNHKYKGGN